MTSKAELMGKKTLEKRELALEIAKLKKELFQSQKCFKSVKN